MSHGLLSSLTLLCNTLLLQVVAVEVEDASTLLVLVVVLVVSELLHPSQRNLVQTTQ
jgi:hypothetical protein